MRSAPSLKVPSSVISVRLPSGRMTMRARMGASYRLTVMHDGAVGRPLDRFDRAELADQLRQLRLQGHAGEGGDDLLGRLLDLRRPSRPCCRAGSRCSSASPFL